MITPELFKRPMLDIIKVGEGKYQLLFVRHEENRIESFNIGTFVRQEDGLYDFEWTIFQENREDFKTIIEGDRPLENFLEILCARREKRKANIKRNKTVIELKREYEKRNPLRTTRSSVSNPRGEANTSLFSSTLPLVLTQALSGQVSAQHCKAESSKTSWR